MDYQIQISIIENEKDFLRKFENMCSGVSVPEDSNSTSQWSFGEEFEGCYQLFKKGLIYVDSEICYLSETGKQIWKKVKTE